MISSSKLVFEAIRLDLKESELLQKLLRESLGAKASGSQTDLGLLLHHTHKVELLRQRILKRIVGRKRAATMS